MAEKFSLKDYLFNQEKVTKLANETRLVYPQFESDKFIKSVLKKLPELELKQRISLIAEELHKFLPQDYVEALAIILKALPPENDSKKTDNDFGDFIYAPYGEFVATYGCNKSYLKLSLSALKSITSRFSVEYAIRHFLNNYPKETLAALSEWTTDKHYHVRRLVSEGTRPKLPWAVKTSLPLATVVKLLDKLYTDNTRYVTRSVANHINDISKLDSGLALNTLKRWRAEGKQTTVEMDYIIKHGLRSLVKQGDKDAMLFLGIAPEPKIKIIDFQILTPVVKMDHWLEFSFKIKALASERLIIDYVICFCNRGGKLSSKKVFKLKATKLSKGDNIIVKKKHHLRRVMTTRTLYPGAHTITIQINGQQLATGEFELVNN